MAFLFSHDNLCKLACTWLQRSRSQNGHGCAVSISEFNIGSGEIPDAIGICEFPKYGIRTVLIEVKMSRSDFKADAKKPHRASEALCMGDLRYYMVPEGLIAPDELPRGWGLLYVTKRGFVKPICGPAAEYKASHNMNTYRKSCKEFKNNNVDVVAEDCLILALLKRLSGFNGGADCKHRSWREVFRENKRLRVSTDKKVKSLLAENKRLRQQLSKYTS